jgi:hypothetical protein
MEFIYQFGGPKGEDSVNFLLYFFQLFLHLIDFDL